MNHDDPKIQRLAHRTVEILSGLMGVEMDDPTLARAASIMLATWSDIPTPEMALFLNECTVSALRQAISEMDSGENAKSVDARGAVVRELLEKQ